MTAVCSVSPEDLYERLKGIDVDNPLCRYSYERCAQIAPLINEILKLKEEKNAVILAHTYVHPDIIYGVADHVGDSYGLAKKAMSAQADTIVFPAVRFMAETAKILNPEKLVIDPNANGGCTLADSITGEEVIRLKKQHPDYTFVCYINTTAKVKAACDICVTSSNVYKIIERLPTDKIYFVPDQLMGDNLNHWLKEKGIDKQVLTYPGSCYVHEQFDPEGIELLRKQHADLIVLAHPECKPAVVAKSDFVGSTTDMHRYVVEQAHQNRPFLLLSECGVASRLSVEAPHARIVGSCTLCKYMRSNSLTAIAQALKNQIAIAIEPDVLEKARVCIERMFEYAE